ncbi:hypothetical protein OK006_10659, partial [Actinobacteria bacterium OK006]
MSTACQLGADSVLPADPLEQHLRGPGSGVAAAERGYEVTVYEYYDVLGGKARSMDVPGTGTGGRKPLPGEHGF